MIPSPAYAEAAEAVNPDPQREPPREQRESAEVGAQGTSERHHQHREDRAEDDETPRAPHLGTRWARRESYVLRGSGHGHLSRTALRRKSRASRWIFASAAMVVVL
jgi:hypothetical protein